MCHHCVLIVCPYYCRWAQQIINTHMLYCWSKKKKKKNSSSTFNFIITTQHYQVKRLQDEMRGCETCQKENQITKRQTEGDGREAQRRQMQEEQSFIPSNNTTKKKKKAAKWDGGTIWPQLKAMHCRSTKINDSNSTLDAHHYPDGVLGELNRPPNQEQTQHRHCSNTTAHLHDSHWFVCNSAEERFGAHWPLCPHYMRVLCCCCFLFCFVFSRVAASVCISVCVVVGGGCVGG